MTAVIETHGLTKRYGTKTACSDVSITVEAGQVYGFLGPNGAGKSTCIKMLTGLVFPTSGSATVLGRPLGDVRARRKLGYLPELFRYQDWMTGTELLHFHARIYGLDDIAARAQRVLKRVGLEGQERFKVGSYSKGMQQRIGLACALLPDPELLFLDEPTSALDPIGRRDVRELILSLKADGATVFLNSHLLSEVEAVCDSIAIIHKGVVARAASMEDLLLSKITVNLQTEGITQEIELSLRKFSATGLQALPEGGHSIVLESREAIPALTEALVAQGVRIYALTPVHETLESAFLRIVGEGEPSSQQ